MSWNARTNFPGSENDLKEAEGLLSEVEAGYELVLSEARLKVNPDFLVVRRAQAELLRKQGALSHPRSEFQQIPLHPQTGCLLA